MRQRVGVLLTLALVMSVLGCSRVSSDSVAEDGSGLPTPTAHPFFQNLPQIDDEVEGETETLPTMLPSLTPVAESTTPVVADNVQALTGFAYEDLVTDVIFDDELDANWRLLDSVGMVVDLQNTDHVYNGRYAIAMSPTDGWQAMYFGVREDAAVTFPQNDVIIISFMLSGGSDYIELDDLVFTVVGSNEYPYWVADDKSAYDSDEYPFSETALYHLDLNGAIPPNTWVEVVVYIHELIYDPAYRYITGFYLKNADDFLGTAYVDDIKIIRFPDPENEAAGAMEMIEEEDVCIVTPPDGWRLYTIQPDDTAASISAQYNVTLEQIAQVNCLTFESTIENDQEIWLPALPGAESVESTPVPTQTTP